MNDRITVLEQEVALLKKQVNVLLAAVQSAEDLYYSSPAPLVPPALKGPAGITFVPSSQSNPTGFENVSTLVKNAFKNAGIVNAEVHIVFESGSRANFDHIQPKLQPAVGIVYSANVMPELKSKYMKWFSFQTMGDYRTIKEDEKTKTTLKNLVEYVKNQNTNCAICANGDLFCVVHQVGVE